MISRAQEAEVLRLYHAEHWPIGTIARQLLLHDVQDALMQQAQGCAGAVSRHLFLRFYRNGAMNNFLHGHVEGFAFFGVVPRIALYDNLKSAVLERRAEAIRFHLTLLELAVHYPRKSS